MSKINKIQVPWLEIPITEHCNLKCELCTHHSPYLQPKFYDVKQFESDLNQIKDIYHTNMMIFLGGEPLLCKNIDEYISIARKANIADFYRITTNGILLHKINDNVFRLIDEIRVSIYPDSGINVDSIKNLLKEKSHKFNFKYTIRCFDEFINIETDKLSEIDAQNSYDNCIRQKNGHLLYNGFYYKCMRPITTKQYLQFINTSDDVPEFIIKDGISVYEQDLYNTLSSYINSNTKLLSCTYCLLGFCKKGLVSRVKEKILNNKIFIKATNKSSLLYNVIFNLRKYSFKESKQHKTNDIVKKHKHKQFKNKY